MGANITRVTDADFTNRVHNQAGLVVVDFWAEWCGPCRMIAPVLEDLATEYGEQVTIAKLNVDENPETAARFGVRSIPTLLFFKGGERVDQVIGAVPRGAIKEKIDKYLA